MVNVDVGRGEWKVWGSSLTMVGMVVVGKGEGDLMSMTP